MKKLLSVTAAVMLLFCLIPTAVAVEERGVEVLWEKVVIKKNENPAGSTYSVNKRYEYEIQYMAVIKNNSRKNAYVRSMVYYRDKKDQSVLSTAIMTIGIASGDSGIICNTRYIDWNTASQIASIKNGTFQVFFQGEEGYDGWHLSRHRYPINASVKYAGVDRYTVTLVIKNDTSKNLVGNSFTGTAVILDDNGAPLLSKSFNLSGNTIPVGRTHNYVWKLSDEDIRVIKNSGKTPSSVIVCQ